MKVEILFIILLSLLSLSTTTTLPTTTRANRPTSAFIHRGFPVPDESLIMGPFSNSLPPPQEDEIQEGCLWVGHLSPDTDSYCTAMAAAELFSGTFAISEPPNRETLYIIEKFGFQNPPPIFDDVYNEKTPCVGIVDHNQRSQSPVIRAQVPDEKITGMYDHHGIQSDAITTSSPISVFIRAWGCTSTLVAETYVYSFKQPPKKIAQCMLSAILSDTLGLTSPTTTKYDIFAANNLAIFAEIDDINELYIEMGTAKSDITGFTTTDILEYDAKEFVFQWASGELCPVYWATLETFSPEQVLDQKDALIETMIKYKKDNNYELVYFSVVNTLRTFENETTDISTLILIGEEETTVAIGAYNGPISDDGTEMDLSPRVSRKKQFIPDLTNYIEATDRDTVISSPPLDITSPTPTPMAMEEEIEIIPKPEKTCDSSGGFLFVQGWVWVLVSLVLGWVVRW